MKTVFVFVNSYRLMSAISERVTAAEPAYPLITANRDFQLMVGKFKALPNVDPICHWIGHFGHAKSIKSKI